MQLDQLLRGVPGVVARSGDTSVEIAAIVSDSRQALPGALFVAYRGVGNDGHRFIQSAVERGAVAVVGELPRPAGLNAPYVQVEDGRLALGWLAAAWYGHPSRHMAVIGVTGTDGKTTTSSLLHAILLAAGERAGLISTVHAVVGDQQIDTGLHTTTPDSPDVQRLLAAMHRAHITLTVLETTSHGLAQHRVTGTSYDVAVVTNVTHEHLDFHGSYEAYREAKAMLFRSLMAEPFVRKSYPKPLPKTAVLNRDDASFAMLSAIPAEQYIAYGLQEPLDAGPNPLTSLRATSIRYSRAGMSFDIEVRKGDARSFHINTPLVGRFNVYNILAAAGAAMAVGVADEAITAGVASLRGIPGRMERIDRGQPFTAIVDFAHTPNALAVALQTGRELADGGRVIAVFGSAGLRDREKRRLMGVEAARWADYTVITAEDPRTESLDAILAETAQELAASGKTEGQDFIRISDRQAAILHALEQARPGDVVMVCGKGHEQSMCFGAVEHPWRDQDALRWALDRLMGKNPNAVPPFILPTWPTFD